MAKQTIYNQRTPLVEIYERNQLLLNTQDAWLPTKIFLDGKLESVKSNTKNAQELYVQKSMHEMLCMYLLHRVGVSLGEEMSLYKALRVDRKGVTEMLNGIKTNPEEMPEIVPIEFKQSKRDFGIQGDTFFGNWSATTDFYKLFTDCFDIILGQDPLGRLLDDYLGATNCPNILDILSKEAFNKVFTAISKSEFKFSSLRAYFACRGMRYLDQTPSLKKGVAVGMSARSYVLSMLESITNVHTKGLILTKSRKYDSFDMVVLNGNRDSLIYFTPDDCREYLEGVQYKVDCSDAESVSRFRGIRLILS